jgi:hypothetical protein
MTEPYRTAIGRNNIQTKIPGKITMPGKLREFFNNKMKELDERRKQLPEVDYLAVGSKYSDAFNFVTRLTELNNERNKLRGAILHLLSENATDEQLYPT